MIAVTLIDPSIRFVNIIIKYIVFVFIMIIISLLLSLSSSMLLWDTVL